MPNLLVDRLVSRAAARPDASIGRGVSDKVITAAETQLAARFPADYRKFLHTVGWYEDGNLWINGLGEDCPRHLDVLAETDWERDQSAQPLSQGLIPISGDGAGNLYALRIAVGANWGEVVFVEAHRADPNACEPSFPTFGDFLRDAVAR